jgi:hypothetical protein
VCGVWYVTVSILAEELQQIAHARFFLWREVWRIVSCSLVNQVNILFTSVYSTYSGGNI